MRRLCGESRLAVRQIASTGMLGIRGCECSERGDEGVGGEEDAGRLLRERMITLENSQHCEGMEVMRA